MNKLKELWKRSQLALTFAVLVFIMLLLALAIVLVCSSLLADIGVIKNFEPNRMPLFYFAVVSLIMDSIVALIFSRIPLMPLRKIAAAADKVADGDYSVRLDLTGPEELKLLSRKFNHMTEELSSVELLRTDFVNNFSHEFKTPIVSIRGFAKMLKLDDLSDDERNEYLDIIIQESERLAELSANVLNLSKIEQQTILTDKTRFNVSEQIRTSIALIDSKWSDKSIDFRFDCGLELAAGGEEYIVGSEELLRQVWINLLDNAVKFSPAGGTVEINIRRAEDTICFTFANSGVPIPPDTAARIFDKFYQGDVSHTAKGNGLGLTLCGKIVQLHGGTIRLKSSDEQRTVFEVQLPFAASS